VQSASFARLSPGMILYTGFLNLPHAGRRLPRSGPNAARNGCRQIVFNQSQSEYGHGKFKEGREPADASRGPDRSATRGSEPSKCNNQAERRESPRIG